jgi:hypothetical protein
MSEQTGIALTLIAQAILFIAGVIYKDKLVSGSSARVHNLRVLIKAFCIAGISVTTAAVIFIIWRSTNKDLQQTIDVDWLRMMVVTWIGIGAVGVFLGSTAFSLRCPSCKRFNAKKKIAKTIVDQKNLLRTVKTWSEFGIVKGVIQILKTTYRHDFQCNYCNHEWCAFYYTEEEQEETEL